MPYNKLVTLDGSQTMLKIYTEAHTGNVTYIQVSITGLGPYGHVTN